MNIFCHKLAEEKLLLRLRSIVVSLGSKVVRIFGCHQVMIVLLDVFNNLPSLHTVTILQKRLQNTASVVLEHKLRVLIADQLKALIYNGVFLLVSNLLLLLLNQQLVVVDLSEY